MPCATAPGNALSEAEKVREDIVLEVKAAMEADACAATVDSWTEPKTQQYYLSFTVHFVNAVWELQSEFPLTIAFDDEETGKYCTIFSRLCFTVLRATTMILAYAKIMKHQLLEEVSLKFQNGLLHISYCIPNICHRCNI